MKSTHLLNLLAAPTALLLTGVLANAAVVPKPAVALASAVFVEHAGDTNRVLEPADRLRRGDRIVTILSWTRALPGGAFTVVNPLPRALQFEGTADGSEDVSVDGGRNWGRLGQLRVGTRLAGPQDVTHVRWRIATPAPAGRIAYSAIVR